MIVSRYDAGLQHSAVLHGILYILKIPVQGMDDIDEKCWKRVAMLRPKPYSVKYEDGKTYQGVQHEQLFNKPEGNDHRSVYSYSVGERVWIQIPGFSDCVHATIVKIKRPHNWRQLQNPRQGWTINRQVFKAAC